MKTTAAAFAGGILLTSVGCSDPAPSDDILRTAARCADINFRHQPKLLTAQADSTWNGDSGVEFVAEVPSDEVTDFVTLSALPQLTPGVPEEWLSLRKYWQHGNWAAELGSSDPAAIQSTHAEQPHPRWIAVEDHKDGTARIFVHLACF